MMMKKERKKKERKNRAAVDEPPWQERKKKIKLAGQRRTGRKSVCVLASRIPEEHYCR